MRNMRVALLFVSFVIAMPAVTTAGQGGAVGAAVEGCCACGACADGDRCIDGATLAACDAACAAAACKRVGFSTKGDCADGCASRPNASVDANDGEEGGR